tara:strand:+ start:100 stop:1653 length:1554 start_codon:yes stop_codon:yes gene_type:complete
MENLNRKIQELLNLFKSKNFVQADFLAKKMIVSYPKNAFLYNFLGLVSTELKKFDEAISIYEKGIKIDKNFSMFYNNIGTIYQSKKEYSKAKSYYEKAIKINKSFPEALNNMGNLYRALNKEYYAIDFYKKAISVNPKFFPAYFNLGITYKNIGDLKKAKKNLIESTKINPTLYTAHRNLSEIIDYKEDNEHLDLLTKIYNIKDDGQNKKEIGFALGKAYEDKKNFFEAYKYYNFGNNLHRKTINFSINEEEKEFKIIKDEFTEDIIKKGKIIGSKKDTPIFILGMPRSGTTLVEQIISSHPKVFGGDELNILPDLVKKYFRNQKNEININENKLRNRVLIKNISVEYLKELKKISPKTKRITDKMPLNFKWIGLIKLILPNAKVIHCTRNSKDICLSIFRNYFVSSELKYAYNQEEIGLYFNFYKDLMDYWKYILPGYIHDVKYEELINNPEQEIKKLLKFTNLSWNIKCLQFYKNKRAVKTASDTQVRKKMYNRSIDFWRNYEPYLANLFKILSN